jgi:hypothetical protein
VPLRARKNWAQTAENSRQAGERLGLRAGQLRCSHLNTVAAARTLGFEEAHPLCPRAPSSKSIGAGKPCRVSSDSACQGAAKAAKGTGGKR